MPRKANTSLHFSTVKWCETIATSLKKQHQSRVFLWNDTYSTASTNDQNVHHSISPASPFLVPQFAHCVLIFPFYCLLVKQCWLSVRKENKRYGFWMVHCMMICWNDTSLKIHRAKFCSREENTFIRKWCPNTFDISQCESSSFLWEIQFILRVYRLAASLVDVICVFLWIRYLI